MKLQKAQKAQQPIKMALVGPSGSGKTYSALVLASGIAKWEEICVIDTEHGSGQLYSDLGGYQTIQLDAPYTPKRYIEAIKIAEDAGMKVIIIDSITHEWDGPGGILEIHSNMQGNSFANWAKVTPLHNQFIDKILQSKAHIIATIRTKQDYVMNQDNNGKTKPEKVGLKAVTRDGVDYEFTLVFDIDMTHNAVASKDRTGLFRDEKIGFVISKKTGTSIKKWSNTGVDLDAEAKKIRDEKINYICDLGKKLGYERDRMIGMLLGHHKVDSEEEFSDEQIDTITAALEKRVSSEEEKKAKEKEVEDNALPDDVN